MIKKSYRFVTRFKFLKACLIILALFMTGCYYPDVEYSGEHPELFTVAIHSLLGIRGYGVDHGTQPSLNVLEVDDYGRQLFSYCETGRKIQEYNLLISQKVSDGYVYFYPHYNFIALPGETPWLRMEEFEDEINALKEANNWNQPMDCSECIRAEIVCIKDEGPISDRVLNQSFKRALGKDADGGFIVFFKTDDYGRSIYLGYGNYSSQRYVAMLFQPDGSFDLETGTLEITDPNGYQTELKLFMESNGWNTPFD